MSEKSGKGRRKPRKGELAGRGGEETNKDATHGLQVRRDFATSWEGQSTSSLMREREARAV